MPKEKVLTPEQECAVFNRGGSLLVSASAGSGKTKVLVDRLFSHVYSEKEKNNIDDYLVITFTEAAASELRGKIISALNERLAEDVQNRHLQAQLLRVFRAEIKTIDAFCSKVVRENIHLIETDSQVFSFTPDYRILDANDAALLQEMVAERVLTDFYGTLDEHPENQILPDMFGFGRDDGKLIDLLLRVYGKLQSQPYPGEWIQKQRRSWTDLLNRKVRSVAETAYGKEILRYLQNMTAYGVEQLERCLAVMEDCPPVKKAYGDAVLEVIERWNELIGANEFSDWSAAFKEPFPSLKSCRVNGNEKDLVYSTYQSVKKNWKEMAEWMECSEESLLEDLCTIATPMLTFLDLLDTFSDALMMEKLRHDEMEFSDQEHFVISLFYDRDHQVTECARQYEKCFREVLVDEFQDTNEVQNAIFTAITDGNRKLFAVGDIKQSIYRFRLADPTIFKHRYETYLPVAKANDGEERKVLLTANFRSRKEVIDAVNFLFCAMMSSDFGDCDYGPEEQLKASAQFLPAKQRETELHLLDLPKQPEIMEDRYERRDVEAQFVAHRIRTLLDEKFEVQDDGKMRPIREDDIAILLRSVNAHGKVYQEALTEVQIPSAIQTEDDFFHHTEIMVMVHVLEILDNPHQDIPLLSVLRSPLLCFTPDHLASIRARRRDCDWFDALQLDTSEETTAFLDDLARFRALAQDLTIDQLIWRIYNHWNVLGVFGSMPQGMQRREHLIAFFEFAQSYEKQGFQGLFKFVHHVRNLMEKGKNPKYSGSPSGSGVRIMSIHKSKGLQFKVVILADLSAPFNETDYQSSVLVHPDLGLGPDVVLLKERIRYPSLAKEAIKRKLLREDRSEELRLLYVAATRAEEKLILVGSTSKMSTKVDKNLANGPAIIHPEVMSRCKTFLDWILLAVIHRSDAQEIHKAYDVHPDSLLVDDSPWIIRVYQGDECFVRTKSATNVENEEASLPLFREALEYRYPFEDRTGIPAHVAVTDLNPISEKRKKEKAHFRQPKCFSETLTASGAEYGTAMHLALQYLPFGEAYDSIRLKDQLDELIRKKKLTAEQRSSLREEDLLRFFQSETYERMRKAVLCRKEFPFRIFLEENQEDSPLLQGVIDCFWEEDDGMHILDFKTDRVEGADLCTHAEDYRPQLEAYANALRQIYEKPVAQMAIFFLHSGKTVVLESRK